MSEQPLMDAKSEKIISLAGKPHNLKEGDFLHMPPNLPHPLKATEQFSMLLTLLKPSQN